jgi:hypothetical protein
VQVINSSIYKYLCSFPYVAGVEFSSQYPPLNTRTFCVGINPSIARYQYVTARIIKDFYWPLWERTGAKSLGCTGLTGLTGSLRSTSHAKAPVQGTTCAAQNGPSCNAGGVCLSGCIEPPRRGCELVRACHSRALPVTSAPQVTCASHTATPVRPPLRPSKA